MKKIPPGYILVRVTHGTDDADLDCWALRPWNGGLPVRPKAVPTHPAYRESRPEPAPAIVPEPLRPTP